ncbi:MAG: hypothetical protein PQJ46_02690 [Spirochaetales bacterium]|nr:hypothetical protein [Spirochaetales bacterium]
MNRKVIIMKSFLGLFLLIVINSVFPDRQVVYNYYSRDYFGHIKLDNIDLPNIHIEHSEYYVSYSNSNLVKVEGYYTGTKILKFIDIYDNSKIVDSIYYNQEGKEIFHKEFIYDDGFLKNIYTKSLNINIIFYSKESFLSQDDGKIVYSGEHEWQNDDHIIKMLTDGELLKNYKPLKFNSIIVASKEDKSETLKVKHFYEYEEDGPLLSYRAKTNFFRTIEFANYIYENGNLENIKISKGYGEMIFDTKYYGDSSQQIIEIASSNSKITSIFMNILEKDQFLYQTSISSRNPKVQYEMVYTLDENCRYISNYHDDYDLYYKVLNIELIFQPFVSVFPDKISFKYDSIKVMK